MRADPKTYGLRPRLWLLDRYNVCFKPVKSDVLNTDMSIVKLAVCVNKFGRSSNPKCDGKTLRYDVLLR